MRGCCRMAAAPDRPGGAAGRLLPAEARADRRGGGCRAASAPSWAHSLRADSPPTSSPDAVPRGVLITRPEPGAGETAARVAALGWRPIMAPLLEIRALPRRCRRPAQLQAILATSGNAVARCPPATATCRCSRSATRRPRGPARPASPRSAAPTATPRAGGAGGAALRPGAGHCCWPPAAARAQALAADLRARGFSVIRRVVYAAIRRCRLPEAARDAFAAGSLAAALFFSAETARHCVRLLRAARLHEAVRSVDALAIGQPAAVALQALPWRRILPPTTPIRTRCWRCCDE